MNDHEKPNTSMPLRWSDLLGAIPSHPGPAPDITTDDVRAGYMSYVKANLWGIGSHAMADYEAAFDRWLAAHDAEVRAEALRDRYQQKEPTMNDARNESGSCPYGSYGAHTYNYERTECIWCGPNRLALAPGKWISNGDGTDAWSVQGYPPDSGWQQDTSPI